MTTEVKYICDVCGQVFDDEELCEQHERAHDYEGITDADCRIFDNCGRQMTFEDCPDDCFYYEVNTERGRVAVGNFLNEGRDWHTTDVDYGQFVWYDEEWVNIDHFRAQLADMENVFGA